MAFRTIPCTSIKSYCFKKLFSILLKTVMNKKQPAIKIKLLALSESRFGNQTEMKEASAPAGMRPKKAF
jgi:hypothetical protein